MNKKEIITIAGAPGGGKSSTADLVAKKLGFKRFSAGDFMRKIALDMGIPLNELNAIAQKDNHIDLKIDDEVRKAGKMEKVVIDSRLAFHWIPNSFKVYLYLSPEIAKERIFNNLRVNALRKESEGSSSSEEIYQKIIARLESEKKRYRELYGLDHTDQSQFDLVIDTNKNNLEEVVETVVNGYKKWIAEN